MAKPMEFMGIEYIKKARWTRRCRSSFASR
jgi:hypothetical protein